MYSVAFSPKKQPKPAKNSSTPEQANRVQPKQTSRGHEHKDGAHVVKFWALTKNATIHFSNLWLFHVFTTSF
jgi:hypothetical protein